jgi:hypothetical protein
MCQPCSTSVDQAFQNYLIEYFFKYCTQLTFERYDKVHVLPEQSLLYADSNAYHTTHLDSVKYTVYLGTAGEFGHMARVYLFEEATNKLLHAMHKIPKNAVGQQPIFAEDNCEADALFIKLNQEMDNKEYRRLIESFPKKVPRKYRNRLSSSNPAIYDQYVQEYARMGIVVFVVLDCSC